MNDYIDENGNCTLCGNWGIIDTVGLVSKEGVSCGRNNICICPIGQSLNKDDINLILEEINVNKESDTEDSE